MELYGLAGNPVPEGAVVEELVAADGIALRAARWPATAVAPRGTVCLFTGWSEQIEKYFPTVVELRRRGFAVAALDWRGQGGSERLTRDPAKGHVSSFAHYRRDIEVFRRRMVLPDCPPPYFALAHSMGGHILLAAAHELTPWIDRLVLSAPFLGLSDFGPRPGPVRLLVRLLTLCGLGRAYLPGQVRRIRRARQFEHNGLTSDPARYETMTAIAAAHPELGLAAPTVGWLAAALASMERMNREDFAASVPVPVMLVNAGADRVVSRRAIETMARRLRNPAYVFVPGCRHEILSERPVYAAQFWAAFDAFVPGSPVF